MKSRKGMISFGRMVPFAALLTGLGLGAATRPWWGDLHRTGLVSFGELLACGIDPKGHDDPGAGMLTGYDTVEELAAVPGMVMISSGARKI